MTNKVMFKYSFIALNFIFTLLFTACVYDPYYATPPHRHVDFYPYDYYYYPSSRVYFHYTTGYYYYLDHNRWVKSRTLLPRIRLDPMDRVRVRVDSNKPFEKYPEHKKKYKPIPNYRNDREINIKERNANRRIYQEYRRTKEKEKDKDERKEKKHDRNKSIERRR